MGRRNGEVSNGEIGGPSYNTEKPRKNKKKKKRKCKDYEHFINVKGFDENETTNNVNEQSVSSLSNTLTQCEKVHKKKKKMRKDTDSSLDGVPVGASLSEESPLDMEEEIEKSPKKKKRKAMGDICLEDSLVDLEKSHKKKKRKAMGDEYNSLGDSLVDLDKSHKKKKKRKVMGDTCNKLDGSSKDIFLGEESALVMRSMSPDIEKTHRKRKKIEDTCNNNESPLDVTVDEEPESGLHTMSTGSKKARKKKKKKRKKMEDASSHRLLSGNELDFTLDEEKQPTDKKSGRRGGELSPSAQESTDPPQKKRKKERKRSQVAEIKESEAEQLEHSVLDESEVCSENNNTNKRRSGNLRKKKKKHGRKQTDLEENGRNSEAEHQTFSDNHTQDQYGAPGSLKKDESDDDTTSQTITPRPIAIAMDPNTNCAVGQVFKVETDRSDWSDNCESVNFNTLRQTIVPHCKSDSDVPISEEPVTPDGRLVEFAALPRLMTDEQLLKSRQSVKLRIQSNVASELQQGVRFRKGHWHSLEDKQLKYNFESFVNAHNYGAIAKNPLFLIGVDLTEQPPDVKHEIHHITMTENFHEHLAKHIERSIGSVYDRARVILRWAAHKGIYTSAETEKLPDLVKEHTVQNNTDWIAVGKAMGRSARCVIDKWTKMAKSPAYGVWTEEEQELFLNCVKEKLQCPSVSKLCSLDASCFPWKDISEMISRAPGQCRQHWLCTLQPRLKSGDPNFARNWSKQGQVLLAESLLRQNVDDMQKIDWDQVYEDTGRVGNVTFLKHTLKNMTINCPKHLRSTWLGKQQFLKTVWLPKARRAHLAD